jgi:hypothetical protein
LTFAELQQARKLLIEEMDRRREARRLASSVAHPTTAEQLEEREQQHGRLEPEAIMRQAVDLWVATQTTG